MEYYNHMESLIKQTKKEFHDAKDYSEKAMHCKEKGDMQNAKIYHEMAQQELQHATNIHGIAVRFMNEWWAKEDVPEWINDKWKKADASYVRHVGKVKYMLGEFMA